MKIPSTFLYDLVHKLSRSEKRFLKVQNGSGEKDYLSLLEALLNQKVFDEEQLIKDHDGANFLKNLAVNKRYLYELLLKSLTHFGEKTIEDQVFEKISATNVLIDKGLYQAAFNELIKGKKLAEKFELFELQIMLIGIEKRLRSLRHFKNSKKKIVYANIFEEEKHCLAQLLNTNEYWHLNQQISQFQMQFQKIQTEEQKAFIEKLTTSPQFMDASLATNIKSKIFYYQANSTYQFMLGNVQKAYENNKEFLDFLESKPQFLRLYNERYLAALNNLLIDSFGLGNYDMLAKGIERLERIPQRPEFKTIKGIESSVFRQKYLLLLNWNLRQKEYTKALHWLPEIAEGLRQFGKSIEKHHRITFYYLSAYILFLNKAYDKALQWNNEIINEAKEDVVKEIFYFSRMLNLLIHFQLENYLLIDSLLLSVPKYLKARREIYTTEKALFSFLKKYRNSITPKEKKALASKFQIELDELFEIPKEKRVFNYLDLRLWINGLI